MFRIYEVYCGERFIGNFKDLSADGAINQAYMKTGSASNYTGNARHMYKAKEIYSRDKR
tara:strand:- start:102 stop:278 length:177 start_codon:yes stop_codon:yes gene_type:complete